MKQMTVKIPGRSAILRLRILLRRFRQDESGNYLIITALMMPVLVGAASFGVEEGLLLHNQKAMQHAADSAAVSAAIAVASGATGNGATQANAVAATYGYVNGANSTTVTVNSPPRLGPNTNNRSALEVVVAQPQARIFSSIWGSQPIPVMSRAVAMPQGAPCILALNQTAGGAYSEQGSVNVSLVNCSVIADSTSNSALKVGGSSRLSTSFAGAVGGISGQSAITATDGVTAGYHYVADPYATVPTPTFTGCDKRNYSTNSDVTLSPGVYCGGIDIKSQAHVTLSAGIYILDQGSLSMSGQSALSGTGVTLFFTSSTGNNYASASIAGGATINLVAPTSGSTAGIAIFGDRGMPASTTFKLTGGDTQLIGGAVYLPSAGLKWAGNSSLGQQCTQIVADTIAMVGNSGLKVNCQGYGTKPLATAAMLVE
jgi:Flp pilus assembly protein TadG